MSFPKRFTTTTTGVPPRTGGSSSIGVTTVNITYRDRADYSGIYRFIDAVKDNGKTIIVKNFSKGEVQPTDTEAENNLTIVIYSIYPLNVEKVMEESDQFVFDPSLVPAEETAETTQAAQ